MRTTEEILETQKNCKPGDCTTEIATLCYKIREHLPLTIEEESLKYAYFGRKSIMV